MAGEKERPEEPPVLRPSTRVVVHHHPRAPDYPGPVALHSLEARIEQLGRALERWNIGDYVALMQRPWRLVWYNFAAGVARGVGIAFGFTVVTAVLLKILSSAIIRNIPVIGQFIAEIVSLVRLNLKP